MKSDELKVAELKRQLAEQWRLNHGERCDYKWPHPAGESCWYPPPSGLRGYFSVNEGGASPVARTEAEDR